MLFIYLIIFLYIPYILSSSIISSKGTTTYHIPIISKKNLLNSSLFQSLSLNSSEITFIPYTISNIKQTTTNDNNDCISLSTCFVYMNRFHLIGESQELLQLIHSFLDNIRIQSKHSINNTSIQPKVILLFDNSMSFINQKLIHEFQENINQLNIQLINEPKVDIEIIQLDDFLEMTNDIEKLKKLINIQNHSIQVNNKNRKSSSNDIMNMLEKYKLQTIANNSDSIDEYLQISKEFLRILQIKLSVSYPLQKSYTMNKEVIDSILLIIQQVNNEEYSGSTVGKHFTDGNEEIPPVHERLALGLSIVQTRIKIHHILQKYFKKYCDYMKALCISNYETNIRKIQVNTKVRKSLNAIAELELRHYEDEIKYAKKVFMNILNGNNQQGFLSNQYITKLPSIFKLKTSTLESYYNINYEVNNLRKYFHEAIEDRMRNLFLTGIYNPFIRDLPFPLTHVNLNYLVEPKALYMKMKYRSYYDDHSSTPALNRADPLLIPGTSYLPFNPNEHPTPKDNRPWYKILYDFYSSNDNDDNQEDDDDEE